MSPVPRTRHDTSVILNYILGDDPAEASRKAGGKGARGAGAVVKMTPPQELSTGALNKLDIVEKICIKAVRDPAYRKKLVSSRTNATPPGRSILHKSYGALLSSRAEHKYTAENVEAKFNEEKKAAKEGRGFCGAICSAVCDYAAALPAEFMRYKHVKSLCRVDGARYYNLYGTSSYVD